MKGWCYNFYISRPNPRHSRHPEIEEDIDHRGDHRSQQRQLQNVTTSPRHLANGGSERHPVERQTDRRQHEEDDVKPQRAPRHTRPMQLPPASPQQPPKLPQKKRQLPEVKRLSFIGWFWQLRWQSIFKNLSCVCFVRYVWINKKKAIISGFTAMLELIAKRYFLMS